MFEAGSSQKKLAGTHSRRVVSVQVVRRCPHCGTVLYEKLGNCDGNIKIKCQKCGRLAHMNLALRTTRS